MFSPSSPTIDEDIRNIVEEVLKERAKQPENQETALAERVEKETKEEIEVEAEDARVHYT